ncbi:MAG: glycosyltransferase family 2 protein [Sphingobacteriaceae bacterium]|nr:glycosyltransferase family 2 protein [Sphingobacteriaceae bacterium]
MKKSLSIIIPNYNGKHLLEKYLPFVFEAVKFSNIDFELIVIDDASKDESVSFLQNKYPEIKLIVNSMNRGFSYTCNRGIEVAKNDLIFLLNSDVELTPNYFEHQWQYFDKEDTFGVMGRIMNVDRLRIEDAARLLLYKGFRIKVNKFYYNLDLQDTTTYTAYLSGANALVCAKKVKELGGFDEIYSPFSGEDVDLSLRAWQLGWKCYFDYSSVCYHQVSASTKTQIKNNFIKRIYYRNRIVLLSIHLNGLRLFFYPVIQIFFELFPKILVGKFWFVKSYTNYLALSHEIKKSRSLLAKLKNKYHSTISLEDIMQIINDSLKGKNIRKL